MNNPKAHSGPIAGKKYPTKPDKPIHIAINDYERIETSIITHERWMNNPPGSKNCHFQDTSYDEVGPNGIIINPEKKFDENAEWQYLEGMLSEKVGEEMTNKIRSAHKKLPILFRHIKQTLRLLTPSSMTVLLVNFYNRIWRIIS